MTQQMVIFRGVSGSGKSTLAQMLKFYFESHGLPTEHVEADQYFTELDGSYVFDPERLTQAHESCQTRALDALRAGKCVIVSNTHILHEYYLPYIRMAQHVGVPYRVISIEPQGAGADAQLLSRANRHDVPLEIIQAQIDGWEI